MMLNAAAVSRRVMLGDSDEHHNQYKDSSGEGSERAGQVASQFRTGRHLSLSVIAHELYELVQIVNLAVFQRREV